MGSAGPAAGSSTGKAKVKCLWVGLGPLQTLARSLVVFYDAPLWVPNEGHSRFMAPVAITLQLIAAQLASGLPGTQQRAAPSPGQGHPLGWLPLPWSPRHLLCLPPAPRPMRCSQRGDPARWGLPGGRRRRGAPGAPQPHAFPTREAMLPGGAQWGRSRTAPPAPPRQARRRVGLQRNRRPARVGPVRPPRPPPPSAPGGAGGAL